MSGLVLTSAASTPWRRRRSRTRNSASLLPGPPVAARSFPQNDQLAFFTDVYDNDVSPVHKVDITTTLTADEGRVVFKNEEERSTADLAGKPGGFGYGDDAVAGRLRSGPLRPKGRGAFAARQRCHGEPRSADHDHAPGEPDDDDCTAVVLARHSADRPCPCARSTKGSTARSTRRARSTVRIGRRVGNALEAARRRAHAAGGGLRQGNGGRGVPRDAGRRAGFSVEIVGAREEGATLVVSVPRNAAGAGGVAAQVLTSPYPHRRRAETRGDGREVRASQLATSSWPMPAPRRLCRIVELGTVLGLIVPFAWLKFQLLPFILAFHGV